MKRDGSNLDLLCRNTWYRCRRTTLGGCGGSVVDVLLVVNMASNTAGSVERSLLGSALLLVGLLLLVLRHANEPVESEGSEDVEDDVDPEDTEVAPDIVVVGGQRRKESVGAVDSAELAGLAGILVHQVAASTGSAISTVNVEAHVLAASSTQRLKVDKLVRSTVY